MAGLIVQRRSKQCGTINNLSLIGLGSSYNFVLCLFCCRICFKSSREFRQYRPWKYAAPAQYEPAKPSVRSFCFSDESRAIALSRVISAIIASLSSDGSNAPQHPVLGCVSFRFLHLGIFDARCQVLAIAIN